VETVSSSQELKVVGEVVNAVDAAQEQPKDRYASSNGIVFKLKRVSRMLVVDAGRKIALPKVPRVFIEAKGRDEENPNDPDYINALREAQYLRGMTAVGIVLAFGTEVFTKPESVVAVDEDSWRDDLTELGMEVPDKGKARYVSWLKYYALNDDDFNALTEAAFRYSGMVSEEDVKKAAEQFRNN
jgi:hypothetical protein